MGKNGVSREQKADLSHLNGEKREKNVRRDGQMDGYERIVSRLKAGSRVAASELVDVFYKQIFIYMRRLGHSSQTSEDLTQEAFLQIWQHIGQLRNSRALNSWIYKVANNVSRLYWRRHKDKIPEELDEKILKSDGKSSVSVAEENEQVMQVKASVAKLPLKLREAVVLHYMQHLTISEAAQAMGIREGTFKSRLGRGLDRLRKQIIKG